MAVTRTDNPWTILTGLYPAKGAIHVGLQTPALAHWYEHQISPANLLQISQTPEPAEPLVSAGPTAKKHTLHAIVSDSEEEAAYHTASLTRESSLVCPQGLTDLWQNIARTETETVTTTTLAALIAQHGDADLPFNWLTINCFPAGRILSGLGPHIADFDIIRVRAILDPAKAPTLPDDTKAKLDDTLAQEGFRALHIEPEQHPAIGLVTYARDWKAELATANHHLTQELADAEAETENIKAELERTLAEAAADAHALKQAFEEQHADLLRKGKAAETSWKKQQSAYQNDMAKLNEALQAASKVQGTLEGELSTLKRQQADLRKTADTAGALQSRITELEADISASRKAEADADARHAATAQDLAALKTREADLAAKAEGAETARAAAKRAEQKQRLTANDLAALQERHKTLTEAYDTQSQRLADIEAELNAAIAYLKTPKGKSGKTH